MNLAPYQEFLGPGDFSDIYVEDSSSLALRWEEEKIQAISRTEEGGAGLRYLCGAETKFGHVDLPRPLEGAWGDSGRSKLFEVKKELAAGLPSLSLPKFHSPVLMSHAIKISPSDRSLQEKIELLHSAFRAASNGPHIRQVSINYGEKLKKVGYLNSNGESYIEKRTYLVFSITVTAERNGDMQTAYESLGGLCGFEIFDGGQVERLARLVAARAQAKLDAPQAPVGEMPVVIASSSGGTLIHEAVGHSLEADAVLEGTSPSYIGKLGKVVANEKLTVYDDPTVPSARGSFHYDDEGVPSEASKLIENGVLRDYMYDRLSARRAKRNSNGHGRRESYAHRPIPRMSNTFIAPGPDDPEKILASFQNGLLVTKMGGGQVNTANGDFVFEVEEGFLVKDGRRNMVRGATLLGNGPEVLQRIDQVGSDHGWAIGTCGKEGQGVPVSDAMPTVHIQKLVIGGQ